MKGGRHEYLLIPQPAGAMDSPSQHTDTLNYIVQFLHTNGLYCRGGCPGQRAGKSVP